MTMLNPGRLENREGKKILLLLSVRCILLAKGRNGLRMPIHFHKGNVRMAAMTMAERCTKFARSFLLRRKVIVRQTKLFMSVIGIGTIHFNFICARHKGQQKNVTGQYDGEYFQKNRLGLYYFTQTKTSGKQD
ncbi:hypothetical protein PZB72_29155 [Catalinimonas niigatensis]|nr:hypothetical protein [Catalinimonas niigatensis]WPP50736.1 hypothetical protein PZB72_29155 [Catalinimonas niigatensis]